MKKLILIFALIPLMAFAQYGQRGASGGSTFYWSLTGQAQKTDSLRIIQGTNMTITQSGNTVTFNGAAGAGSTANVRANTGWTSNGTTAQDTLATYYDINGKFQRLRIADTDGDSLILAPHALFPFAGKDGTLLLFAFDSTGRFGINAATAAQAQRAFVNVLGRATNDTLAIWSNDGGGVVGDSAWIITGAGVLSSAKATASTNILIAGSSAIGNYSTGYARFMHASQSDNGAALIQGSSGDTYVQSASGQGIIFRVNAVRMAELSATGEFSAGGNFAQQAAMQIRKKATADTLFMARNDGNSTLDSTMMVFANGRILRRDTKALPAGAWLATASNGAALSSSNYMVTYAFDTATAETLTVDFPLPPNFIQISNVEIEVVAPNTDGDSVGFAIAWLGRAADEAFDVAFSSPLSGQIDLGTTANARKILTISGTFSNLAASDRIILKLWRDPSVANDVAADVHLVEVRVNGNGLLY